MNEARAPLFAGRYYFADAGRLRVAVESFIEDATQIRLPSAPIGLVVPHGPLVQLGGLIGAAYKQTMFFPTPARVALIVPTSEQQGNSLLCDPRPAYRTPLGDLPVDHALVQQLRAADVPIVQREDGEPVVETQAMFILEALGETPILPLRVPAGFQLDQALCPPDDTLVVVVANVGRDAKAGRALETVSSSAESRLTRWLSRSTETLTPDQAAFRLGLSVMRALGAQRGQVLACAGEFLVGAAY